MDFSDDKKKRIVVDPDIDYALLDGQVQRVTNPANEHRDYPVDLLFGIDDQGKHVVKALEIPEWAEHGMPSDTKQAMIENTQRTNETHDCPKCKKAEAKYQKIMAAVKKNPEPPLDEDPAPQQEDFGAAGKPIIAEPLFGDFRKSLTTPVGNPAPMAEQPPAPEPTPEPAPEPEPEPAAAPQGLRSRLPENVGKVEGTFRRPFGGAIFDRIENRPKPLQDRLKKRRSDEN